MNGQEYASSIKGHVEAAQALKDMAAQEHPAAVVCPQHAFVTKASDTLMLCWVDTAEFLGNGLTGEVRKAVEDAIRKSTAANGGANNPANPRRREGPAVKRIPLTLWDMLVRDPAAFALRIFLLAGMLRILSKIGDLDKLTSLLKMAAGQ